jgi:hypothetical protein
MSGCWRFSFARGCAYGRLIFETLIFETLREHERQRQRQRQRQQLMPFDIQATRSRRCIVIGQKILELADYTWEHK